MNASARIARLFSLVFAGVFVSAVGATEWFVSPSQPNGHVTGAVSKTAHHLYAVEITEINGKRVGEGRRDGVWLTPGEYTIQARRAKVRGDLVPGTGRGRNHGNPENNTVDLVVEEGKTYYLALDASTGRHRDWKLVVWKVE